MKPTACEPCAKRKVRCDGEEPCNHCKRRKQDHCAYPSRIVGHTGELRGKTYEVKGHPKTPESTERDTPGSQDLGAPDGGADEARSQAQATPLMVTANGNSVFLESPAWENWNGKVYGSVRDLQTLDQLKLAQSSHVAPKLVALQSILNTDSFRELSHNHPLAQEATTLWETYHRRVNPLLKVTFDRDLTQLRSTTSSPSTTKDLTPAQHALVFAIYFVSVRSLFDEECTRTLNSSRPALMLHYQQLCEQALLQSHFFSSSDLTVLQAMTIYSCAGFGAMSSRSLQTFIGLVIRNGERIGLHRDGTVLGLSVFETEKRRRIWWQLQQLDLGLSVHSGSTSLSLTADWDTAVPLNIEDSDLTPETSSTPVERKGLTSMSYCLSTYWLIQEMRSLCMKNFGKFSLSWPSEKAWSIEHKRSIIEQLEDGVNKKFLQYCDPIRPLDTFMQLIARTTVCTLKRFMLHPLAHNGTVTDLTAEHRKEMLDLSVDCLEYDIAMNATTSFQSFRWRLIGSFPWSALIYVLVEACQKSAPSSAEDLWSLIAKVYNTNASLSSLADDHRKPYAARLLLAAWDAREQGSMEFAAGGSREHPPRPKPLFLQELERELSTSGLDTVASTQLHPANGTEERKEYRDNEGSEDAQRSHSPASRIKDQGERHNTRDDETNADITALFDPDEIDWLFWDTQLDHLDS